MLEVIKFWFIKLRAELKVNAMKEYSRTVLELIRKFYPLSGELVFLHCMLGPELLVNVPKMLFHTLQWDIPTAFAGRKFQVFSYCNYMQRNWLKSKMKENKRHFQTLYEIWEQTAWLKMIYNNLGKQYSRVKWLSWMKTFSGKTLYYTKKGKLCNRGIDKSRVLENKRTWWECDKSKNHEFVINNFGHNIFL